MKWLLILVMLISCASLHPVTDTDNSNTSKERVDTVAITIPSNPSLIKIEPKPQKKETEQNNIALLLPFHTEELFSDSSDIPQNIIPKNSMIPLHYYEGVLLALDSLDKLGLKINLHVYDSGSDSFRVKEILSYPEMKSMDIIIGPLNNSSLSVTANYCKENNKYAFSPLASSSPVTDNSHFVLMNATLKTHCENMMKFIQSKIKPEKSFLVYHRNTNEDVYAGYYKNYTGNLVPSFNWTELTQEVDSSYFSIKKFLTKKGTNAIVVPSFDEVFITNITRQLYELSDSFDIVVFGMPTWSLMESLRTDYLQRLNTYITASFWLNYSSPSLEYFRAEYFNKFKSKPAEFTYQGYNLMFFIGSLLQKGKTDIEENLQHTKVPLPGVLYDIKPVTDSVGDSSIQYFENKYVHILKYANNTLIKVN